MSEHRNNKCVVLITIDALRPDHLASYGYFRNTAPHLEKFIEKGSIFLKAITNGPETPSSFSAIFTSILPFLEGGYSPLPLQKTTFPQILNEHGIFTYAIHSNPNLGRFFNYDRGFDVFLDGERYKVETKVNLRQLISSYLKKLSNYKDWLKTLMYRLKGFNKVKSWIRNRIPIITDFLLPFAPIAYNAPYMVNKIISFLQQKKSPFFLWVHFMDVHSPYNPPSKNILNFRKVDFDNKEREFLTSKVYINQELPKITQKMIEDLMILYDGQVNYLDENLGRLFNYIQHYIKKDCLVIITADHGESFYEHGFFGHQGSIYDELLKIPLFVVEIGKKPKTKKVDDTVQLLDIPPTVLDYFEIEPPELFQGKSILPLMNNKEVKKMNFIFSECYQKNGVMKRNEKEGFKLVSIRRGKWKYIYDQEYNREFLFDIELDPIEKVNVIMNFPDKLNEFRTIRDVHFHKAAKFDEKSKISKAIKTIKLGL